MEVERAEELREKRRSWRAGLGLAQGGQERVGSDECHCCEIRIRLANRFERELDVLEPLHDSVTLLLTCADRRGSTGQIKDCVECELGDVVGKVSPNFRGCLGSHVRELV